MTATRTRRELENPKPSIGAYLALAFLIGACLTPIILLIAGAL